MRYHLQLEREGRSWSAIFVDAPGCAICASSRAKALASASVALAGWLESHMVDGLSPPRPAKSRRGTEAVAVDPKLAIAIELRWARQDAGLTQAQVAERAEVSQQQIARLERPGANPSIATLRKVAGAIGLRVELEFVQKENPL